MRLSTEKNDMGYREDAHRHKAYLNGKEQKYCLTADTDKGFCILATQKEDGSPVIVNGNIKRKIVFGEVRVEKI